jgi:hypothetical protein
MNADVSKEVLEAVFESSKLLDGALVAIRERASPEEHRKYLDTVSRLLVTMLVEIINPILAEHPQLTPDEMKRGRDA